MATTTTTTSSRLSAALPGHGEETLDFSTDAVGPNCSRSECIVRPDQPPAKYSSNVTFTMMFLQCSMQLKCFFLLYQRYSTERLIDLFSQKISILVAMTLYVRHYSIGHEKFTISKKQMFHEIWIRRINRGDPDTHFECNLSKVCQRGGSWEMLYIGTMMCLMLLLGFGLLLLLVKQWNGSGMHNSCVIWTLIQRGRYASQVENLRSTHSIQVEYRLHVCSRWL